MLIFYLFFLCSPSVISYFFGIPFLLRFCPLLSCIFWSSHCMHIDAIIIIYYMHPDANAIIYYWVHKHLCQLQSYSFFKMLDTSVNSFIFFSIWPTKLKQFFWLKHSWFITLCQFLLSSKMTQSYRYIHSFAHIIFHHVLSQEIGYT